ncbi:glycosyltransferase family 2 protein [Brucella sp. NBRC 12950]|uniref:glycosyltransferase family 2 protein n=1 Tax=Brucella sp. NBRC 12950 TaxID=2994518 RepID=UPI0024A44DE3|nr:glycosyltransferase family 2 protein [Brucella sp. NBRC 12950]GLU27113.1 hypothetical protein Brsp01_23460 [Brucella sp. NBRC 12950]
MKITGIMLQRDEIDVVLFNVLHHLNTLGFSRLIIGDNGSTDGSREALRRLEKRDPRLLVVDMPGEFAQADRTNLLYQIAIDNGADWVVPLDADEFLSVNRNELNDVLKKSDDPAVHMRIRNFAQTRRAERMRMHNLASMYYAVPPSATAADAMNYVLEGKISFLESIYPPKYIWRADKALLIAKGNHKANIDLPDVKFSIDLNHAPIRSKSAISDRIVRISRLEEGPPTQSWHIKRLAFVDIEEEWRRSSVSNGHLDVKDTRRRLQFAPFFLKVFLKHALSVRSLVKSAS